MTEINNQKAPDVGATYIPPPEVEVTAATTPPTLKAVTDEVEKNFQEIIGETFIPNTNEPVLPKSTLSAAQYMGWLQNGGFVEIVDAKIKTLQGDMQAQAVARKMVIAFAQQIYNLCMDKVESILKEAQLNKEKGYLEADRLRAEAYMSLASAATSLGSAYASRKYANSVQNKANERAAKAPTEPEAPKNKLDIRPDNKPATPKVAADAPPVRERRPSLRIEEAAPPVGEPASPLGANGVKVSVAEVPPAQGGAKISVVEKPPGANEAKGALKDLKVEGTMKDVALTHQEMSKLTIFDQTFRGVMDGLVGAAKGFVSAGYQIDISDKQLEVDKERAVQASFDAFLELLRSFMETERKSDEQATGRMDQDTNMNSYNQSNAVAWQRL